MCKYVKIDTGQNFPPLLKIVTHTLCRLRKMLMLLNVHVTSVLFLVRLNNFALTMGFYWPELHTLTLIARSYVLLIHCPVQMADVETIWELHTLPVINLCRNSCYKLLTLGK